MDDLINYSSPLNMDNFDLIGQNEFCPVDRMEMKIVLSRNMDIAKDTLTPKLWWYCNICGWHELIGEIFYAG